MDINSTKHKLRDLGYYVEQYPGRCLSIKVFDNIILLYFFTPDSANLNMFVDGHIISYQKWIHDHHNILKENNIIYTFDELLIAISRATIMGG
jgi:hypothetical protein